MKIISLLLVLFLSLGSSCFAQDIEFNISVDKNKSAVGEAVYLNLNFDGTQDIAAPNLGEIEGFSVRYVGPSSKMSIVNGRVSSSITHIYVLVPLKTGTFKIGPFSFEYKGKKYTSTDVTVEVVKALTSSAPGPDSSANDSGLNLEDRIFLMLEPSANKGYLNEMFDIKVKLYVNSLGVKNIQYPQIKHDGFSLQETGEPVQYRDIVGGRTFDVIEFRTKGFPMQAGQIGLGPASLKCDVLLKQKRRSGSIFDDMDSFFGDFFSEYQHYPVALNSPQTSITVMALPETCPESFHGAVGEFIFEAEVSPVELKAGDPVTLRINITGRGNFNTVKFPELKLDPADFKVYEPQVSQKETSKKFEAVIIPLREGIEYIPAVKFSFFNPGEAAYKTAESGPFKINVVKGDKTEDIKIVELSVPQPGSVMAAQELGRDIIFIKGSPGRIMPINKYLYKNKLFLLLQILPLLCFLGMRQIHKHRHRIKTDQAYAKKLKAPKIARQGLKEAALFLDKEDYAGFYETIFKTLQKYLGYKLHIPWAGITSDIAAVLKEKKLDNAVLDNLKIIMSDCDTARYAASGFNKDKMRQAISQLRIVLDYLERKL